MSSLYSKQRVIQLNWSWTRSPAPVHTQWRPADLKARALSVLLWGLQKSNMKLQSYFDIGNQTRIVISVACWTFWCFSFFFSLLSFIVMRTWGTYSQEHSGRWWSSFKKNKYMWMLIKEEKIVTFTTKFSAWNCWCKPQIIGLISSLYLDLITWILLSFWKRSIYYKLTLE